MWNTDSQKRICYFGISLLIVGQVSFSNHPYWGDIITVIGALIVITMKIVLWRTRSKTT